MFAFELYSYLWFWQILHGEQYIEFVGDYPRTEGTFTTRCYVVDILDKGSSAVAVVNSKSIVCQSMTVTYDKINIPLLRVGIQSDGCVDRVVLLIQLSVW